MQLYEIAYKALVSVNDEDRFVPLKEDVGVQRSTSERNKYAYLKDVLVFLDSFSSGLTG
jgi:hypothetical protein